MNPELRVGPPPAVPSTSYWECGALYFTLEEDPGTGSVVLLCNGVRIMRIGELYNSPTKKLGIIRFAHGNDKDFEIRGGQIATPTDMSCRCV